MELLAFVVAAYFLLYTFALSIPAVQPFTAIGQAPLRLPAASSQDSLEAWLDREEKIALDNLLANVAPGGRNVRDAAPGSVIASPSKQHPNYYYQWIRDAAITTSTLVHVFNADPFSALGTNISEILAAYGTLSYKIQHTANPSGTFEDKFSGLGEPKFHADGSAYTENWGRPQRDGPALRAITLMAWLRAYNETNPSLWTSDDGPTWYGGLYEASLPANSIIKADLEYVSHHWWESGFDLWEEIQGLHFFTAMVQRRALREGAELARAFGDYGAAGWYEEQVHEMDNFMGSFWSERKGHIEETLDMNFRSGLDCGTMLGALHGTTRETGDQVSFSPHSDEVLLSLLELVRDQRNRFPINAAPERQTGAQEDVFEGVGVGRYPEDRYDGYEALPAGGNPWFLCTSSVAEILYRTAEHFTATSSLYISERGLPFWSTLLATAPQDIHDALSAGKSFNNGDPVFSAAINRLKTVADGFLGVVKRHSNAEGNLSEQFDRVTGFERGAADLTWSYGAFLEAVWARKRVM